MRPARCSVQVNAQGNAFEQQVQKIKDDYGKDLPFPLEYGYAGVAWGASIRPLPTCFPLDNCSSTSLARTTSLLYTTLLVRPTSLCALRLLCAWL